METEDALKASKVALGSIHLTLQNVTSTAIGVFGIAYLARAITQEQMGILAAVTFISSLIQISNDFGLSVSISKYVSELKGRGQDISAHFISAFSFKLPLAITLCTGLYIFSENVSSILLGTATYNNFIKLAAADAFTLSFSPLFYNLLLGTGHLKRIAACQILNSASRWFFIIMLVWNGYGLYGAILGWIIGDLVLLVSFAASSIKLIKFNRNLLKESWKLTPSLLKFSWPLFAASAVTYLYTWYDRAIVLAFLPLTNLGIYNVNFQAFTVLVGIATALGSSLFPYYGMAYGRNDHKAITAGIKKASRYTAMIICPLTLGLFATAKPAITLFAGQQYEAGWTVLAILSIFALTYSILSAFGLSGTFSGLLLIYENTKTLLLLSFIPIISSLVLMPLLSILGLNALALMRGISLVLTLVLTMHFLSKIVNIEIDKQAFTKTLAASATMAATVLAAQQLYYNKLLLPAYVLIGVIVYVAAMRLLKVPNRSDINLIRQILGEKPAKIIAKLLGCSEQTSK